MSDETIVAIYDTPAHAKLAAADLREAGVPEHAITIHAGAIDPDHTGKTGQREPGFWSRLFGGSPDHDTSVYERSVGDGASVLIVATPDKYVTRVMEIVESHQPIDIDERAISYGASGAGASSAVGSADPATSQQVANRGGSRVRRFVVEQPH